MDKSSTERHHELWEDDCRRGIRIADWSIETCKRPILSAQGIDDLGDKLTIPLPEIVFGNNYVSLKLDNARSPAQSLSFTTVDALDNVDKTGNDNIKVAYAASWAKSRKLDSSADAVIEIVKNFDWTYSTDYAGTSSDDLTFQEAPHGHAGIPLDKLARRDVPILFYDDVTLYEDELHDNGIANLSVKIRVMPNALFILSRFFLRVDNVLFRVFDVRLYHEFGSTVILRETRGRQAAYNVVKQRLPWERPDDLTPLTDANWVANILGMLEQYKRPSVVGHKGGNPTSVPRLDTQRVHVAEGISIPQRTQVVAQASASAGTSGDTTVDTSIPAWRGLGGKLSIAHIK